MLQAQIDKLTLRAPLTGVVLRRVIEPGEMALPGASLLTIGDTLHLYLTVYIPENRYGEIELGQPGTGQGVAEFLRCHAPLCPVILHTSNFDGRLAMHNRLRAGGWTVSTAPPREPDWIQSSWLPIAKRLIGL